MCLRVQGRGAGRGARQPACNACERPIKPEEHYPCHVSICSRDSTEVVLRPLRHAELVETKYGNPECSLNPTRIEGVFSYLQDKVSSRQQRGRQQSLMRSRWAPGNEVAERNPNNSLHTQQPLSLVFGVSFGSGVANAGVASQMDGAWKRKVTTVVEESGKFGSSTAAFMNYR